MPAALPLQTHISQATQGQTAYKIIEVKYGNGYAQRAGDGINPIQGSWNVEWGVLSAGELGTIVTAFDTARGVDYFTWTPPGDASSKKWVVKQHSRTPLSGDQYSVAATLEETWSL
jgi:phage-related protein